MSAKSTCWEDSQFTEGSKNKNYAVPFDSNTTHPAMDKMKAAKAWRLTRHSKSFLDLFVIDREGNNKVRQNEMKADRKAIMSPSRIIRQKSVADNLSCLMLSQTAVVSPQLEWHYVILYCA